MNKISRKYLIALALALFVTGGFLFWQKNGEQLARTLGFENQMAAITAAVKSPFVYNFAVDGTLQEAGRLKDSSSPYWWVNSGGVMVLSAGIGQTSQGELPVLNKWRVLYAKNNPLDTDNGYHPQNIFRMPTRSLWQNATQQVYFNIAKLNMSESPNRNASNGILLFNRYQDGNNLYYTGIRVDGTAIIKKKQNGTYYTMASKNVYKGAGTADYSRDTNPNLIPSGVWLGLKSEVVTKTDGTVSIKVYMDKDKTGNWVLVAEAVDDGKSFGGAAIVNEGYGGIRTDFMDVLFDDYKAVKI